MAKTHVWHWFHDEDLQVTGSNSTWTLAANGSLSGQLTQAADFSNDTINVDGVIRAPGLTAVRLLGARNEFEFESGSLVEASTAIETEGVKNTVTNNGHLVVSMQGIDVRGDNSIIENGVTGLISGSNGIITTGINAKVVNDGRILVDDDPLSLRGAGSSFVNNGSVGSATAGAIDGADLKSIVNGKHGDIYSAQISIGVLTNAGEHMIIINHGKITTDAQFAIVTADGNEKIVNNGRINGGLVAGPGNDVIDMRGGHITGPIIGGTGNDTLITDDAKLSFEMEIAPPGDVDTIKSTVSYTLVNAVADLILFDSKDTDGTGNEVGNTLKGNIGDNVLKGLDGNDVLDGGKGNDRLFGGADGDTFGFATGYGKDEIRDFDDLDHIYVHNWKAIGNFSELKSHATDHGADVWITAGNDTLVIDHMHKADLQAADFQF